MPILSPFSFLFGRLSGVSRERDWVLVVPDFLYQCNLISNCCDIRGEIPLRMAFTCMRESHAYISNGVRGRVGGGPTQQSIRLYCYRGEGLVFSRYLDRLDLIQCVTVPCCIGEGFLSR